MPPLLEELDEDEDELEVSELEDFVESLLPESLLEDSVLDEVDGADFLLESRESVL